MSYCEDKNCKCALCVQYRQRYKELFEQPYFESVEYKKLVEEIANRPSSTPLADALIEAGCL